MGNAKIKHVGARFTIVPNAIIDDSGISFRAKGIYAYLRSKPDDWEFRVPNIVRAGKEGRDAIQKALKELEVSGYIERIANRTSDGCFVGWIWYIYETPISRDNDRLPENPSDGFSVRRELRQTESQAENNNTIHNKNIHNKKVNNNKGAARVVDIFQRNDIPMTTAHEYIISILLNFSDHEIEHIASVLSDRHRKGRVKNPIGLLRQKPQEVLEAIQNGTFYPDVQKNGAAQQNNEECEIYSPEPTNWVVCTFPENQKITMEEIPHQLRRYGRGE